MVKFLNCESFDNSYLYKSIDIEKCNKCGHMYNELDSVEIHHLIKYYEDEYAPINLSSKDKKGDKPGSDTPSNIKRYEQVFDFILPYINHESKILDVGCAMGGFLRYCQTKGYFNIYGIDPIKDYVKASGSKRVRFGSVYSIPFEDNSFDIVILDQVLEHLVNLKLAMREIKRVLTKGGLCYIGVPDSEKYNDTYFYIMREHIQHFNIVGLKLLAHNNGFELIANDKTKSKMIGALNLPNLSVLLKMIGKIYCWGIGREFMYLYPNTRLKHHDLILVDDTPEKQNRTFKGMKIYGSDILKEASKDSFLIITANVHKDLLIKKAKEIGYKGQIINV